MIEHRPLVLTDAADLKSSPGENFQEVHRKGLPHRAVHVEIVNKKEQYFLWARNDDGRFEIPGGHVDWLTAENRAETYSEAAAREIEEELNCAANWDISGNEARSRLAARLAPVVRVINQIPSSHWNNNEWVTVFTLSWPDEWGDPCGKEWRYSQEGFADSGRFPRWLPLGDIENLSLANPTRINAALRLFLARRGILVPFLFKKRPEFGEPA